MLHYGKHHLTYNAHKSTYVYSTLLSQIRIHTHSQKDSLEHMHIETTEKERGGGGAVVQEKGKSERKGSGRKSAR